MARDTVRKWETAIPKGRTLLEQALEASPQDPDLNYRMGTQYLNEGDAASALDHFHLTLHFSPADFRACAARVQALHKLGRPDEEALAYREFLRANPGHAGAAYALARWHHARAEYDTAVTLLRPFAAHDPVDRDACNLLGLILGREFGRFDEGAKLLRRALEPDATWPEALSNLGWLLMERGEYLQGLEMMEAVLTRNSADHETRLALACMNLKRGEFASGWRDYEARHQSTFSAKSHYDHPRWQGEPGTDKTLLIVGEQGLGDQIMFASCFSEAMRRCGHTLIECDPRLAGLFRRSFPGAELCAPGQSGAKSVNLQIPMGSLPGLMRNRWEDFPAHQGYLHADPERVEYWRSRLKLLGPGPKIGISWRGGVGATRSHLRSIDLEQFLPIMASPVRAVSLQYGDCDEDLQMLRCEHGVELPHWQDALDDYEETAALVCALDLVVSVCTAVVHLTGALGRPVWVLVPTIAEWRYLHRGSRLPWYPSARLYRQAVPGEWVSLIAGLADDISARYPQGDAERH